MPSAPVALSFNASTSHAREAKVTEADAGQSPFNQVLAQEVSRQDGGAKDSEPVAAAPAQDGEALASDASGDEIAQESVLPEGAAMPWLLMMQQVAQPAPVVPPVAGPMAVVDGGEELPMSPQGTEVSAASFEVLVQHTEVKTVVAGQSGVMREMPQAGLALDSKSDGALAANAATESGKALPQDVALAQEENTFAEMFFERRATKDETGETPWVTTSGQIASQPLESGQQAGKVVAQHVVAEPVGESRWGEAVAQRVSMMLGKQEQQVDMQLNPPHLGPMEVRLTLGQEQASVLFTSQHAAVREALAAATPKLTALLADQGIQLVNVQVASDSLNQQAQEQSRQQQATSFSGRRQEEAGSYRPFSESAGLRWSGEVSVPVARSGVSLYV